MENNNLKNIKFDPLEIEYIMKFHKLPRLIMTMSYQNEVYVDLMKKAIKRGTPVTSKEIDDEIERRHLYVDLDGGDIIF